MSDYVYNLLKKHHSVRSFKKDPVSEESVKQLIEAGQVLRHPVIYKRIQLSVLMTLRLKKI